jgi:hypothetical protein
MKELEEDPNKWIPFSMIHIHGLKKLLLLKYPYYLKQYTHPMYPQNSNSLHRNRERNLKICTESQNTLYSQRNIEKQK